MAQALRLCGIDEYDVPIQPVSPWVKGRGPSWASSS